MRATLIYPIWPADCRRFLEAIQGKNKKAEGHFLVTIEETETPPAPHPASSFLLAAQEAA